MCRHGPEAFFASTTSTVKPHVRRQGSNGGRIPDQRMGGHQATGKLAPCQQTKTAGFPDSVTQGCGESPDRRENLQGNLLPFPRWRTSLPLSSLRLICAARNLHSMGSATACRRLRLSYVQAHPSFNTHVGSSFEVNIRSRSGRHMIKHPDQRPRFCGRPAAVGIGKKYPPLGLWHDRVCALISGRGREGADAKAAICLSKTRRNLGGGRKKKERVYVRVYVQDRLPAPLRLAGLQG